MTGDVEQKEAEDVEVRRPRDAAEHSRLIMSTSSLLLVRQVVVAVVGALSTAFLARLLTVSDFGTYSAALATYYFAVSACDLGFATVLARDLASRPAEEPSLMRSGVRAAATWSGVVALAVVCGSAIFGTDGDKVLCLVALAPALAMTGASVARQVLIVRYDVRRVAAIDLSCNVGMAVVLVVLAAQHVPLWALSATVSLFVVLNTLLVFVHARHVAGAGAAGWRATARFTRRALPFGIASFLASAYFTIDLVIAGFLLTGTQVAPYAAAVKLLTVVTMLPGLVMSIALVGISALNATADQTEMNRLISRLWRFQLVVVGGICWLILCFAGPIVGLFFGSSYGSAVPLVRVLMGTAVVALASGLLGSTMVALNRGAAMIAQNAVALVANVALNVWLLPIHGVQVAAWLTLATEIFVCTCTAITLRHVLAWRSVLRVSVGPAVSFATMSACVLIPGPPLAAVVVAVVVFIAAVVATRSVPDDLQPAIAKFRSKLRVPDRAGRHRTARVTSRVR